MVLTKGQRVFVVKSYAVTGNISEVQRQFCKAFNFKPTRVTIHRICLKFDETGSVERKKSSGRPKTVVTDDNRDVVRAAFEQTPSMSISRASRQLGIPASSVQRILKEIKMKPYEMTRMQALNEDRALKRYKFAERFIAMVDAHPSFMDRIVWTGESCFRLDGHHQESIQQSIENADFASSSTELDCPTLCVWAGIWSGGIIGPFYFNDATLNGDSYLNMLEMQVWPALQALPIHEMFLQQDGTPAHYKANVRAWLDEKFPQRWIGRGGPISWPPRSPDLTPMDFSVWGIVKDQTYAIKPSTMNILRETISHEMAKLDRAYCQNTCRSVPDRLRHCMAVGGVQVNSAPN